MPSTSDIISKALAGHEYSIEMLPVGKLDIDLTVQRDGLRANVVQGIVSSFNPLALGIGTVSDRGHGFYVVLDGAHRVEALRRLTDNEGHFQCRVLTGLSEEEEARIFLDLNSGTQPTPYEKFRVGVKGNKEALVEINEIVHAYGLTVGNQPGRGVINAIAQLGRIHKMRFQHELEEGVNYDPRVSVLSITLKVITKAWGAEAAALQSTTLDGLSKLLERNFERLDLDRLVSNLSRTKGGPAGLVLRARQYAQLRTIKVGVAMAQLMTDEYNTGLQATSRTALPNYTNR